MGKHWLWERRSIGFAVLLLLVSCLGASGAQDKTAQSSGTTADASSGKPVDASQYVGSETCKTCHEDVYNDYMKSPHAATLGSKKGPAFQGCEGCHGPGKAHAESADPSKIFNFKTASAKAVSERCLACHSVSDEQSNFLRSPHMQNGVACTQCHSPHFPKVAEHLLNAKQPQLCYGCHLDVKQQFDRPFHHRVNEGLIQCSDCHNPHGSFQEHQLRSTAAQDAICTKCHTEKQGPFVYEHPPVKVEGCVSCHTPHGSSNPRLLKVAEVNILCLQCHAITMGAGAPATPSFHNQAQKYQACTMCHVAIHGSNFDPDFFK